MSLVLYAVIAILFLAYKLLSVKNDYFEKKGLKFSKPAFLVGSRTDLIFRNKPMPEVVLMWYNEFRNEK